VSSQISLYERVANHPKLKPLMDKLEAEAHKQFTCRDCVAELSGIYGIAGYLKDGTLEKYFFQKGEEESIDDVEKKIEALRSRFSSFVVYTNTIPSLKVGRQEEFHERHYCFPASLEDRLPESKKGKWLIEGFGPGKALFSVILTEEELVKFEKNMFKYLQGEALVHEIGTHIYTIVREAIRLNDENGKTLMIYAKRHDIIICEEDTKKIEIEGTGVVPDCA